MMTNSSFIKNKSTSGGGGTYSLFLLAAELSIELLFNTGAIYYSCRIGYVYDVLFEWNYVEGLLDQLVDLYLSYPLSFDNILISISVSTKVRVGMGCRSE